MQNFSMYDIEHGIKKYSNVLDIEYQAFSLSYDLAPPPPPFPSPVSKLSFFLCLPVCRWSSLLMGEWEAVGEEPNHTTSRKPDPL
jgi:hypothetical protein